jgi:conjugative transposon TraN protein
VKYANEPQKLNIEMQDFIHDGAIVNRPNNSMDIYLLELRNESPKEVDLAMKSIYKNNKKEIKNIESKRFGIQFLLKGIYIQNDLLYFHTEVKNLSNVPFDVDFIRWKIVDKKVAKRTAIQETVIEPVRASHFVTKIQGRSSERTVFAMNKFTIPDDKKLVVELFEKNGGRHQSFSVGNDDIIQAEVIAKVK